jgi:hypothetical protein
VSSGVSAIFIIVLGPKIKQSHSVLSKHNCESLLTPWALFIICLGPQIINGALLSPKAPNILSEHKFESQEVSFGGQSIKSECVQISIVDLLGITLLSLNLRTLADAKTYLMYLHDIVPCYLYIYLDICSFCIQISRTWYRYRSRYAWNAQEYVHDTLLDLSGVDKFLIYTSQEYVYTSWLFTWMQAIYIA